MTEVNAMSDADEEVVIPFGRYRGRTLGEIADDDLLYVDWLAGARAVRNRPSRFQRAVDGICERRAHEIRSLMADG